MASWGKVSCMAYCLGCGEMDYCFLGENLLQSYCLGCGEMDYCFLGENLLHSYCLGCGEKIDSGWFGGSLLCGYYSLGSDKGVGTASDEPHSLCGQPQ